MKSKDNLPGSVILLLEFLFLANDCFAELAVSGVANRLGLKLRLSDCSSVKLNRRFTSLISSAVTMFDACDVRKDSGFGEYSEVQWITEALKL